MWGLTVLNEPDVCHEHDNTFPWTCLAMNGTQQRDFIKHDLGPLLFGSFNNNSQYKDLVLMAYDTGLKDMLSYVTPILSDPEAAKYVAGLGFHWYTTTAENRRQLDELNEKYPNKFQLATEASLGGSPNGDGNWEKFNHYVDDIIKDLNQHSVGWVDWSLAKDPQGNPNWAHNRIDPSIVVNPTVPEYYKQPMYYAVGHFSRFITPGSIRLHHSIANNIIVKQEHYQQSKNEKNKNETSIDVHLPLVQVTVFIRPDNGTVVQVFNPTTQTATIEIHDLAIHPINNSMTAIVESEALQTFIYY